MARPARLRNFPYVGPYRYFVTCCTRERRRTFTDCHLITNLTLVILRTAGEHDFEIDAYCFMPDHLHLVLTGQRQTADFRVCMKTIRQRTSHLAGESIWQDGYHEHVLRSAETIASLALYVVCNPVRAGLVTRWTDYPFVGGSWVERMRGPT